MPQLAQLISYFDYGSHIVRLLPSISLNPRVQRLPNCLRLPLDLLAKSRRMSHWPGAEVGPVGLARLRSLLLTYASSSSDSS